MWESVFFSSFSNSRTGTYSQYTVSLYLLFVCCVYVQMLWVHTLVFVQSISFVHSSKKKQFLMICVRAVYVCKIAPPNVIFVKRIIQSYCCRAFNWCSFVTNTTKSTILHWFDCQRCERTTANSNGCINVKMRFHASIPPIFVEIRFNNDLNYRRKIIIMFFHWHRKSMAKNQTTLGNGKSKEMMLFPHKSTDSKEITRKYVFLTLQSHFFYLNVNQSLNNTNASNVYFIETNSRISFFYFIEWWYWSICRGVVEIDF